MMKDVLVSVILCGGSGSRLWPVSREQHPKPFITLPDGESLIQKAFLCGTRLPEVAAVIAVTNHELSFKAADAFNEINQNHHPITYILEPFGRNTAAAIALAALQVQKQYGDQACLLVLPADHLIKDRDAFGKAIQQAEKQAKAGQLVTFGIRPSAPETAYGYIEVEGDHVLRFVEKPALETAKDYIVSGNYLWNAGIFCFTVDTILKELDQHCPEVLKEVRNSLAKSKQNATTSQIAIDPESFARVPDISIDYAVMERSAKVGVVPCDIGWSDLGSWTAISGLEEADAEGNCVLGEAVIHNAHNCYIRSDSRMIGVAGVDNLIVVDTSDALLVTNKDNVQNVKNIYNELKSRNHETYKTHRTVQRPWGSYTVLEEGEGFKIKRIVVNPGGRLSLQMHHHRSEHWVVVSGTALVTNGDEVKPLTTNQSTYISAGHKHRLENHTNEPVVIIEVQTGDYLGEDDIVRFDDVYSAMRSLKQIQEAS